VDKSQIILVIVAGGWLLISHAGDLWGMVKSAGSSAAGLFRRKTQPVVVPVVDTSTPINDLVASFLKVKPRQSAVEASALWARLEPAAPTLETAAAQPAPVPPVAEATP
jgi:hypothetical protein